MDYWKWYHKSLSDNYSPLCGTYDVKRLTWDSWNTALEEAIKYVTDAEAVKEINKLKVVDYLVKTPEIIKA